MSYNLAYDLQFDPKQSIHRRIMLTRGKFLQTRQIIFRYSTSQRKMVRMTTLRQLITNGMKDLTNMGFGKICEGVFFKNPRITEEQLNKIGVAPYEYKMSLNNASASGFSTRVEFYKKCVQAHIQLYGK